MFRGALAALTAGVALTALMAVSARAQSLETLTAWCADGSKFDQAIKGCDGVIASGRLTGKDLANAFYDRGNA